MDTELVFWWDGQERLRVSIRSNDGRIIETNRRATPLRVPAGAEIKTPDGELVGTVVRVTGAGANRYDVEYVQAEKKKARKRKRKAKPSEPDGENLVTGAEALESDLAQVLDPEGQEDGL